MRHLEDPDMTDETPKADGEPSPATPEEAPTAETTPFTYDHAAQQAGDEDDVPPAPAPETTQATQATEATPTAAATAPAVDPATGRPVERPAGIFVPKWVGIVAAAIIAALVFGGIGYAIGDSSSGSGSSQNASAFPGGANGNGRFGNGGQFPGNGNGGQFPGNGNGNSNGGGQTSSNAGFLGVGVDNATNGVAVTEVQSGSPAANAGLQKGDVITAVDGTNVTTPQALQSAVQQHSSGDQITITYTRNGTSNTVKATLTSRSTTQSN
jgi:membrane-associated protease RseP (regulator of RpoE activity)